MKAADEALKTAPDDVDVSELKSSALAKLGRTADAVKMLEELAVRTEDAGPDARSETRDRGRFQQGKDYQKAVETYRASSTSFRSRRKSIASGICCRGSIHR